MSTVYTLVAITSIPGLALLLVVLAAVDRMGLAANRHLRLPWHRAESGRPMAAPGLDELHAIYYAAKRHELDQRQTSLMLRDEEGDAAPPRSEVDLEASTAVIRLRRSGGRTQGEPGPGHRGSAG
ncbi:DUF6191 domain-containing protein [Actinomadura scrupuli]|uniref:DUF6191 domain-containing protein n=1 Tax=Actinomadura scrupuli TaxID=559629 RepID=UPI003D97ABFC